MTVPIRFGTDGWRGVIGEDFTEENAARVVQAVAEVWVAEAGAGKSRLCHELAERCRARGIVVRSGAGVPHGRSLPLEPLLEFYREIYGIAPEDTDALARQKIAVSGEDLSVNQRMRALREHLSEIHRLEEQERRNRRLTARISRLWGRTGPTP